MPSERCDGLSAEKGATHRHDQAQVEHLQRVFVAYHKFEVVYGDGAGQRRLTSEGIAALEDAIRFLKRVEPCPPLRLSRPLCRVAARRLASEAATVPAATATYATPSRFAAAIHTTASGSFGR